MSILKIARMGHPVLRLSAAPVDDPGAPEIQRLVADMGETLDDAGGIGLAATQVYAPWRVVIFEVPDERLDDGEADGEADGEGGAPVPRTVLINPVIEPLSDAVAVGWEGCLSVPGMRGAVPRFTHIRYSGLSESGEAISREASGFHARVVQHECDHLDGILYPMRMTDMSTLHFVSEVRHNPGLREPLEDEGEDESVDEREDENEVAQDEDAA
jgi:peptide deformylase